MNTASDGRDGKALLALCVFSTGAAMALFAWCVAQRMVHPFELEWMEGGSLQHLVRIAEGLPLYPAPSLDFVPFPYPPLYYYAAFPLTPFFGVELLALRVLSVLSTLATAGLLAALVRFETGRTAIAIAAAGLFLATYLESGAYMDVARLDSFFVLVSLAGVVVLRTRDDLVGWLLVGLLAATATLTKQTAPAIFGPLILWAFMRDRFDAREQDQGIRRALTSGGLACVIVLAAIWWIGSGENTHFFRYILGAQAGHEIRWWMVPSFFAVDLFYTLPIATAVAVWGLWRHADRGVFWFYVALFVGVVAACIVPRVKVGGAMNNLIPLHATAVLLGCVGWGSWSNARAATQGASNRFAHLAMLALVAQFAWLGFDPRIALPRAGDLEAGVRFVEQLRRIEGEVLMPAHGYLARMAGKRVFAHQMPVDDIQDSGLADAAVLRDAFTQAIAERRFALVIDATDSFLERYPNDHVLKENYRLRGPVFEAPRTLIPRSGWPVSPGRAWTPIPREAP
ncbi:MAG: glycosyltransferase family 39 protein [Myxococcota bacterium]|jgi:hypothetical protein|nr:glycosyltransferase family 39 protein [Myxococcota bacterium]